MADMWVTSTVKHRMVSAKFSSQIPLVTLSSSSTLLLDTNPVSNIINAEALEIQCRLVMEWYMAQSHKLIPGKVDALLYELVMTETVCLHYSRHHPHPEKNYLAKCANSA